jgi:mannitol/fructose-specific phosphotransferase system IIA component (Ntr-type)
MKTDGQTVRGNGMAIPHVDLEFVKEWARRRNRFG